MKADLVLLLGLLGESQAINLKEQFVNGLSAHDLLNDPCVALMNKQSLAQGIELSPMDPLVKERQSRYSWKDVGGYHQWTSVNGCHTARQEEDKKQEETKKGYLPNDPKYDEKRKVPAKYLKMPEAGSEKKEDAKEEQKEGKSDKEEKKEEKKDDKKEAKDGESKEEKKDDAKEESKEEKKDEKKDDDKEEKDESKEEEKGIGGDSYMAEMVKKYAIEGGKDKEAPDGKFWFDKKGARAAAKQAVVEYLHMNPAEAEQLTCDGFGEAWEHEDAANEGKIEADRLPKFVNRVAG